MRRFLLIGLLILSSFGVATAGPVVLGFSGVEFNNDAAVVHPAGSPTTVRGLITVLHGFDDIASGIVGEYPVTGGLLSVFTAPPAAPTAFHPGGYTDTYTGGVFALTGAVFGLPADTVLMSGEIESGFSLTNVPLTNFFIVEEFTIDFLHPLVLDVFGPAGYRTHSLGAAESFLGLWPDRTTFRTRSFAGVIVWVPEPDAFVVLALGAFVISVAWRRRSATG